MAAVATAAEEVKVGSKPKTKKPQILVLGDVGLDIYAPVSPRRNYEGAKECVTGGPWRYLPAMAANVAWLISEMGALVTLVGACGRDGEGLILDDLLEERGIDTFLFRYQPVTTVKMRVEREGEVIMRVDRETPVLNHVLGCPVSSAGFDCVVFSDYGKGLFTLPQDNNVRRLVKEASCPTLIDPCCRPYNGLWKGVTVATPNLRENAVVGYMGTDWVAVTQGSAGVRVTNKAEGFDQTFPCRKVPNPQVVGAGDAFVAGMAYWMARGTTVVEAVECAISFAGSFVASPR